MHTNNIKYILQIQLFKLIVSGLVRATADRGQTNMTGRGSKVSLLHSSRLGSVISLAKYLQETENNPLAFPTSWSYFKYHNNFILSCFELIWSID